MSLTLKSLVRGLCGAALLLSLLAPTASAASTLLVDPLLSNVTIGINVGFFIDDEGNGVNPDTNQPYSPGDVNPNTGNPVIFFGLGASVGQGDPSAAAAVAPGGVVPIFSNGATAQLNGTVDVNSIGFSITSAAIGLNTSGLWQPGIVSPGDSLGPPAPAELGIYIDAGGVVPGEYVVATINNTQLSLNSANAALSGGNQGNFSGPGTLTLVNALLNGFAAGPLNDSLTSTITNESTSTTLSGNFSLLGNIGTLNLPFNVIQYAEFGDSLPGVWAQINQSGVVVATGLVPEPSTLAMAMTAMVGMGWYGIRRRTRRAR